MSAVLDSDRLEELIDTIGKKIIYANRTEKLESLLDSWGLHNLIEKESLSSNAFYNTHKDGKIVVLGSSQVKKNDLLGIITSLGLDKNRFEFYLDYEKFVSYPFSKLQYNPKYRLVIVGSMPHSTSGKGNSSSAIANMEKQNGYPKIIRLGSNNLKITKTNFKTALQEQQAINYI